MCILIEFFSHISWQTLSIFISIIFYKKKISAAVIFWSHSIETKDFWTKKYLRHWLYLNFCSDLIKICLEKKKLPNFFFRYYFTIILKYLLFILKYHKIWIINLTKGYVSLSKDFCKWEWSLPSNIFCLITWYCSVFVDLYEIKMRHKKANFSSIFLAK